MDNKANSGGLAQFLKKGVSYTTDDIHRFYANSLPNVKRATVNWRIHRLVQQGILQRIGRGVFTLGKERSFLPVLDKRLKWIAALINKQFPLIKFCCWRMSALKELFQHMTAADLLIVEVEREAVDAVFYFLKESQKNIFKEPSRETVEDIMTGAGTAVIIKPMISESPLMPVERIWFPTLEKMLVDLCMDKELFYFIQGSELNDIIERAVAKYTINFNKLFRYAKRRGKNDISRLFNT
jgi:hypothetical protein